MNEVNRYEEPKPFSREEALAELKSEDPDRVGLALIGMAMNDEDWRMVQNLCIQYLEHEDVWIRKMAITSLGCLGRQNTLDIEQVFPLLLEKLEDSSLFLKREIIKSESEYAILDTLSFSVPEDYNQELTIKQIESTSIPQILVALWNMGQKDEDWMLCLNHYEQLLHHSHFGVRGFTTIALAELALTELPINISKEGQDKIDLLLQNTLKDPHEWVREKAKKTIDIISNLR